MSNIPKKQHYVPQFLLNNWSQSKKKRVFVFDKKSNKVFSSSIKNIAHENNFYKDEILGYENNTELKLSKLEGDAAPVIKSIISEGTVKNLTDFEHKSLCLFSAVQMLRTNNTREFIDGFNEILSEKFQAWGVDPNDEANDFSNMSKEEVKSSSIGILNSLPTELVDNFIDKELTLLEAPTNCSFYISDHPIIMHNHFPREHRGNLGIGLYGIEIYFPISPKYCLSFLCADLVAEIKQTVMNHKAAKTLGAVNQQDITELVLMVACLENKTSNQISSSNMDFNNSNQVINSTRYIYSASDDFSLANDMLKINPGIATQPKVVDGSKVF
jgi:hypothetical protein